MCQLPIVESQAVPFVNQRAIGKVNGRYLEQTMKATIRFLVQFTASYIAFLAEMISLATNVTRNLTLHWIIRRTGVCSQLEANILICLDVKNVDGIFMC